MLGVDWVLFRGDCCGWLLDCVLDKLKVLIGKLVSGDLLAGFSGERYQHQVPKTEFVKIAVGTYAECFDVGHHTGRRR